MNISLNEIKTRATAFAKEWEDGKDREEAALYYPNTMPPVLVKAHQALDKAVDLCYMPQPFTIETKRIEYLFELYDQYTAGLFVKEKKKKQKKEPGA